MAIGTGEVKMSELAAEIAVGSANFSLKDNSVSLWKSGPTAYATFLETRYFGSNCQFSTVVAAQGSAIQASTDPWAEIAANGMNVKPCGMGEWKGYDHFPTGGQAGRSTIGRFRVGTDANSTWNNSSALQDTNPSPLNDVVAHIGAAQYRYSHTFQHGNANAPAGIALWAEKASGVVYINLDDIAGGVWGTGSASSVATNVQQLGPSSGAGQTTTADTQGSVFATTTLMKITGASRITGCKVSLEAGLPTDAAGDQPSDPDGGGAYSGNKVMTIDHDDSVTTGATSTTNFGATKIGYDLCCGGNYYGAPDYGSAEAVYGVEFNFYATQNDGIVLNSNPLGPVGFRSHKVTVYVSVSSEGEFEYIEP